MIKNISPNDLRSYLDSKKKVAILDVREPEELSISALPTALNIPLMQIPDKIEEWIQYSKDAEFRVVICRVGGRSAQAVQYLNQFLQLEHLNLEGGINKYAQEIEPTLQVY